MTSDYALVSLDQLFNDIQSELPGLASDHGKRVIKSAVNRFLERACVWRYVDTPSIDDDGYAIFYPPKCSIVCSYRDVTWCGDAAWWPRQYGTRVPYELRFLKTPEKFEVGDLSVTLILKMATGSAQIPDYVLDVHYEALRAAALNRLMLEANKPYSDPQLGAFWGREASARMAEAKDVAERSYGRNEHNWTYPRWV